MPRKKKYHRETAVDAAMKTFWVGGYTNVGVRQIEEDTSINRFALQTEFGGKEGLYLETLDSYFDFFKETMFKPVEEGGLDGIKQFFQNLVTADKEDLRNTGCLIINAVVENADLGLEAVQEKITSVNHYMVSSFEKALKRSKKLGEIDPDFDVKSAALYLRTFSMGVQVYVRMNSDVKAAKKQVGFLLKEIESWRTPKN